MTIKIVMANYISKAYVMQNLKRLKGSEIEFGKLRVTDYYTLKERELLKKLKKKLQVILNLITGSGVIQKMGYIWHFFPR